MYRTCGNKTYRFMLKILAITTVLTISYYSTISVYFFAPIENQEPSTSTDSSNATKYIDQYDKLLNVTDFKFIINAVPCQNESYNGLLAVIIVTTDPTHFENRRVIRETWGRSDNVTTVVFLVGETSDTNVTKKIQEESRKYGDIVQGNFVDSYRNMTYKHVMGLKWVTHHCPNASFVIKADDDIVVNMDLMRSYLTQERNKARNMMACIVQKNAKVERKDNKWKVLESEFSSQRYPTYCSGWVIVYTQDLILGLLGATESLPYFWIDDVQITGLAAKKVGAKHLNLNPRLLTTKVVKKINKKKINQYLIGPYNINSTKMVEIWKFLSGR